MKRFTLIIDGHNFFFRSLWSAFRQGHKNKILTSQKDVDTFEKKLMLDFYSVVKMMNPIVNDIVFVKDSHSWRKDLLLQQEYKGNRKKLNDNIDRDGFTTVIDNFTQTLNLLGVKISQVDRSEGDDLVSAWSESLFQDGKSSIILSTDKDLTQLVKCVNDVHIIQYTPIHNKLYVSKESNEIIKGLCNRTISHENLFEEIFTISIENDPFEKFFDGVDIEEVNPEYVRFCKIIGGDTSDNIYPVYYKRIPGKRSKGLGEKTVNKVYEKFKQLLDCDFDYHIYSNEDILNILSNIIYDMAKIKDDDFTKAMLIDNIKTNTILVSLTPESIPEDVQIGMISSINEEKQKKQVVVSKITKDNIFAKSRFKDYKSSIKIKSNIIKDIKDDGDMSFIKD